ncbi:pyocin S6 family toxin immunity protein [Pseudomonas sp. GD03860]|uniref:pyocin S6 family toxin immunity protein n=1 Tax=Pseudomonas TaxID=286 RepID=UPI0023641DF7|nr:MULTISPECIES: pyocin S6 family toxin immunity protein [Pseudomonas]MDD2058500.1 pyocin S6 family toxin immunity protein [Pseudomonas putida]MDH0640684.1 pyocin S6 family toxin immunity protein [Pseudomonas sp. GD03860]
MYLCISGFLPDDPVDDLIKFELYVDSSFNDQIVQALGHKSLNAMAEGEWLLTSEQVVQISEIISQPLPTDLKLFIGVEA